MAQWEHKLGLTNLNVRTKLFLGFGSSIILVIALTINGAMGQWTVDRKVKKADDTNRIVKNMQEARIAEKNFDLRREDKYVQELKEILQRTDELSDDLMTRFDKQSNREEMAKVIASIDEYQAGFEAFVNFENQRAKAIETLRKVARDAEETLEQLKSMLNQEITALIQSGGSTEILTEQMKKADTVDRLIKGILEARRAEKNFMITDDEQYTSRANEIIGSILQGADRLEDDFTEPKYEQIISRAGTHIKEYEKQFNGFLDINNQEKKARGEMLEDARSAVELAEVVRADQKQQVSELESELLLKAILLGLGATVMAIFAGWLINRLIVPPLRRAQSVAKAVADGDLTKSLPKSSEDEVGQLMHSLHTMTEGLKELVGRLRGNAEEVASSSEELSVVTSQTSSGVLTQREEIDQIATALEEMSATIQEVAKNAENAAAAAEEANEASQHGDSLVAKSRIASEELAKEVAIAADQIESVKQDSNKVSGVIDVIRGIAEQTNLLALNAAIEAARAGEHGRGFAVVADEVRSLSQRTQESTEDIAQLIQGLLNNAESAVELMETNQSKASDSASQNEEASEAIRKIANAVERLSDMNAQIASAASQQNAAASEISRSVEKVREISQQTANGAEETSASSDELARLGQGLQEMTERFRL